MANPQDESAGYMGMTPPPDAAPVRAERHLIDRPADLVAMANLLAKSPVLAIDVEFVSARPTDAVQTPRLALIQIADAERCFVVDALRIQDLTPLNSVFAHPEPLKIFHGVGSDVRVLRVRDVQVVHTLDVEAVSRAHFGQRESGLQAMLQRACGVRMDKTLQRSDWTQRPLPMAMFAYAARDAEMTYALYLWLRKHFERTTDLYEERADDPSPDTLVAPWLAAFVMGDRNFPPELVEKVTQVVLAQECRRALGIFLKPTWRARVLRAAADLVLVDVAPLAIASLDAESAEERAAAARALGRLRATSARTRLEAACQDPVADVRQAALTALEHLEMPPRVGRFARGAAPEVLAESGQEDEADTPWKARLRDLLQE